MENITKVIVDDFLQNNTLDFNSTHKKLSLPIINKIFKKMKHGHHRCISSVLAGFSIGKIEYHKTSAKIEYKWKDVEFINEDWDTEFKIKHLNHLDAEFNNISIEKIIDIIR